MGEETNGNQDNVSLLDEKDERNLEGGKTHRIKSLVSKLADGLMAKGKPKYGKLETVNKSESDLLSDDERESLLKDKGNYKDKLKGTLVSFLVVLKYTASAVSVQLLERRIPDLELNAIRCGGASILYLVILLMRGTYPSVPRRIFKGLLVYILVTTLCSGIIFVSMAMVPVSAAQSLQQTSQIISGIFLFALVLRERITLRILLSSLLCIAGIIWDFLFPESKSFNGTSLFTTKEDMEDKYYGIFGFHFPYNKSQVIGYAIAAIAGIFVTLDVLVTKFNTSFTDYLFEIPFFAFVAGTLLSVIGMLILETPTLPTNWMDVFYIVIHTLAYTMLWPLYIYVFQYISGNTFNIIWSTSTVFMLLAQYTILSSILPGHRNWMEVFGVLLVTIGASLGSILNIFLD